MDDGTRDGRCGEAINNAKKDPLKSADQWIKVGSSRVYVIYVKP
jgi:hypothetical protein